jgi:hypothetical protein
VATFWHNRRRVQRLRRERAADAGEAGPGLAVGGSTGARKRGHHPGELD